MTALLRSGAFPALKLPPAGAAFLDRAVAVGLIDDTQRSTFLADRLERLRDYNSEERVGHALIQAGLLTSYQYERLFTGMTHGLVLGNYVVLSEIGKGGMGVVYKAAHRLLRRAVAVKVLPLVDDCPNSVRQRFFGEMRLLAELSHPNVVLALDAGEMPPQGQEAALLYLVTELIEGGDIERYVLNHGVLPVPEACQYIRQAALGLQAAHDRHLIHRDIKPSNLLRTETGLVKLVDFGLARQFSSRLTDQRSLLGSIEFMPPEQSHDPSAVGMEADLYALGATLFWLLAGEGPYPTQRHVGVALRQLQTQPPRRLRDMRPDVPPALDNLMSRLLSRNPSARPTSALAVANALRTFTGETRSAQGQIYFTSSRVLVVGATARTTELRDALEPLGCEVLEAGDGIQARQHAAGTEFDLIVDATPGGLDGFGLGGSGGNPHLTTLLASTNTERLQELARHALELKQARDRATRATEQLARISQELESSLHARSADLREAHNALLFALAKMAEQRDGETAGHLKRMQEYTRVLAIEASRTPPWQGLVDERFLEQLVRCVPLHDIGKIGLPDEILLKPASLTEQERQMVEEHSAIGDRILEALGREHGTGLDFLSPARVIVRHHHERWDGRGYPDRLVGDAIPPLARLVAVADVYDALRRMRMYKPAHSHATAVRMIVERSTGQFDPTLMEALKRCQGEFERIYREFED